MNYYIAICNKGYEKKQSPVRTPGQGPLPGLGYGEGLSEIAFMLRP